MTKQSLKILGILPHSIAGRLIISGIFYGFKALGCEVVEVDLLSDFVVPNDKFDFIAGYGFSAIKFNVENNLNLKTINYFADVIETSAAGSGFEEYRNCLYKDGNYSFYWDRSLAGKSDYKNLFYMPLFVNTEIYKNKNLEKEYDVMFAGRLDTDKRLNTILDIVESSPELNLAWYAIEKHYNDALSRAKNPEIIKKIYKGFLKDENAMADAINKSKLVINVNSQGESSINFRTFEALACETLLLSDEREELNLFNGLIPTYTDDLKDKIKYYLSHDNSGITKPCRKIIIKNHDAKVCAEKMLKLINF